MSSSHRRTYALLIILGLILLTPWVSAAELRGQTEFRSDSTIQELSLGEQIWRILARLWAKDGASAGPKDESQPAGTGTLIKCENGGSIDPDGHCRP